MCTLCELSDARSAAPLVFASRKEAFAALHDDWAVRGHSMIVSTAHVENAAALSDEEAGGFFALLVSVERALLEFFSADRVLVLKLGLATPHLHYHLYPVSNSFKRSDFLDAIALRRRDEPEESEQRDLVTRLRERIG